MNMKSTLILIAILICGSLFIAAGTGSGADLAAEISHPKAGVSEGGLGEFLIQTLPVLLIAAGLLSTRGQGDRSRN